MNPGAGETVAVTGAGGGIGRQVVEDLLAAGYRVRSLSRSRPQHLPPNVEHLSVDLAAHGTFPRAALDGCAAVVHLAAYIPSNQNNPASAEQCLQTNSLGTLRLLEATERAGIGRFVQTTSANAYAPGIDAPREDDPMYPWARAPFYLSSKLVQDVLGSHWNTRSGVRVATLRISSVYGAGIEGALFTRFARALRAGEKVQLVNGGTFGADFVERTDVARAIMMTLANEFTGPLNIASGERSTLLKAARCLVELTGANGEQLTVEPEGAPEPGFPAIDITKARALGFEPADLRSGLARLVRWVDAVSADSL